MSMRRKGQFGSVYRRGRAWCIRIRLGGNGARGDPRRAIATCECKRPDKPHDCPARDLAEAALAKARLDSTLSTHLGVETVASASLEEWLVRYWPLLEASVRSRPGVVKAQLRRWSNLLGSRPLSEVTRGHVDAALASMAAGGSSAATRNRYLAALSRCFEAAVEARFARANPCRGIPRPRETLKSIPWVSAADLRRIALATPAKHRALVVVATDTGLRLGELLALERRDVDFNRRVVLVRAQQEGARKSGRDREVPLTETALEALRGRSSSPLFPVSGNWISRVFPTWAGAAGIPDFTFHGLRHAYCSHLAANGVPIPTIALLAGHRSISVTMRYARHSPGGAARAAVDALAAYRAPRSRKGTRKGTARGRKARSGG